MEGVADSLVSSFIDDRIRCLWHYSLLPSSRSLSADVQRAICSYFGETPPDHLVAVFAANLRVFNLLDESIHCCKAKIDFNMGCFLYPVSRSVVICIGGKDTAEVASLNVETRIVTRLPPMYCVRGSPGVVKLADLLYIFGGTADEDNLVQSEIYSLGRRPSRELPNMQYARSMFSACLHGTEVLLPGGEAQIIESFSISTETYTALPVRFPFGAMASVSVIVDGEMVSLFLLNQMARWRVGSPETFCVQPIHSVSSGAMVYSGGPAVVYNNKLYFPDVTGNLSIYDIHQNTMTSLRRDYM